MGEVEAEFEDSLVWLFLLFHSSQKMATHDVDSEPWTGGGQ